MSILFIRRIWFL